jgi:O-methyltransferase involved in polyketide biosynthesis
VLQLGCGLDSRVYWIDPPPGVLWFDVGYRNVIGLRQKLYPERAGCRMIGLSVTEPGWLDEVPGDRPGWITAEGLTHYLSGSDVETLLNRLTGHFSAGRMAFDAVNRLDARLARNSTKIQATGANIGCWLDDTHDIKLIDLKLEPVIELRPLEAHRWDRLPGSFRALLVMDLFPSLRTLYRLLRYRF